MSLAALDAARAYGRVVGPSPAPTTGNAGNTGFADLLGSLVTETAGALRTAETASAKQVAGSGDLVDVVTAIGAAETALDTMVAVRDRVVSAYQDIMRMQI